MDGNGRLRQTVVIANPQGLHLRPAMAFARLAQQFQAAVTVIHGDRSVNGKSLIDLMLLAVEQGTELIVEVDGADAQRALPALAGILAAPSADSLETD
jgi:phosphotransferase system HPr (HPr) family protein